MSKLMEFTLFPKLPPELRIRVWHYAALIPRIAPFSRYSSTLQARYGGGSYLMTNAINSAFQTKNIGPALFSVCRESRHEALKMEVYRKMFSFLTSFNHKPNRQYDGVLFNPEIDVLLVDMETAEALAQYGGNDCKEIRYVAVYDDRGVIDEHEHWRLDDFFCLSVFWEKLIAFRAFHKLESMWLILRDEAATGDHSRRQLKDVVAKNLKDFFDDFFGFRHVDDDEWEAWNQDNRPLEFPSVIFLSELETKMQAQS